MRITFEKVRFKIYLVTTVGQGFFRQNLMTSPALEPRFKTFFTCLTFLCQNFSFRLIKVPGKVTEKFMENPRQSTGKIKAQVRAAP